MFSAISVDVRTFVEEAFKFPMILGIPSGTFNIKSCFLEKNFPLFPLRRGHNIVIFTIVFSIALKNRQAYGSSNELLIVLW
jgi:hypothetical protein